jgi:hypothetical protein
MTDAPQLPITYAGEDGPATMGFIGFDGRSKLATAELITGTPTVTALPAGQTIDTITVNSSTITVDGVSHVAGKAVQWRITGSTANTTYRYEVTVDTDAGNTFIGHSNLRCDE